MTDHCPSCGCVIGRNTRSGQDHRRFFALIKAAYLNWPESVAFQPSSEDQCRAFLLCKAGWTNVAKVEIPASYAESPKERAAFRDAVEGASRALGGPSDYHELRVGARSLEIITARSIAYSSCGQRDFGRVREAVEAQLEDILGVSAQQLLSEKAA